MASCSLVITVLTCRDCQSHLIKLLTTLQHANFGALHLFRLLTQTGHRKSCDIYIFQHSLDLYLFSEKRCQHHLIPNWRLTTRRFLASSTFLLDYAVGIFTQAYSGIFEKLTFRECTVSSVPILLNLLFTTQFQMEHNNYHSNLSVSHGKSSLQSHK